MCSIEGKIPPPITSLHQWFWVKFRQFVVLAQVFVKKRRHRSKNRGPRFPGRGGGGGGGGFGIETEIRSHNLISLEVPGINPKFCA